jgi:DNA-binding phage protein
MWSGISRLAPMSILRGMRTTRSSGPHPAVANICALASSVMSTPIMAKSPDESSRMSGHPWRDAVCCPFAWGSCPRRRKNIWTCNYSGIHCQECIGYPEWMARNTKREAICANVAAILREERQKRGISLNVLAADAGLSRQMVSYVEQNERNPTLETLLRITDTLGIELDDVIKRARHQE